MRIHLSSILIDDQDKEIPLGEHRWLGVTFTQEPVEMGPVTTAVFDDTCGNLIQIAQHG